MICVSLAERTMKGLINALPAFAFAEVRLDAVEDLTDTGLKDIFARHSRLIATHRPGRVPELVRIGRLLAAVKAGAAYVDVEIETENGDIRTIAEAARARGCRVIVSYHNESETPSRDGLEDLRNRGFASGADLVKIACLSRGPGDNARLLGLLDDSRATIVIGMGPLGRITRLVAPLLGAPFTYASPAEGKATAAGQPDIDSLRRSWEAWKNV